MKQKKSSQEKSRRSGALPPLLNTPCIELSGNRELLIEGSRGVLEYAPDTVRVNTAGMILSVFGRELNLRCISESALMIDGFIMRLEFTV